MPLDNKPADGPQPHSGKSARAASGNVALALELPFTFVGAIAIGVLLGYFLDRWLHTRALFMLILGALGFVAGLREVLRRLPGTGDGANGN
ncbi:MAG TPA: AtpZ/AtpI family protein [Candidatus Methylomirabilis sp.]|nr:AtpZ/AtpI family protein [Candidatus Methylomirabilis sp.]